MKLGRFGIISSIGILLFVLVATAESRPSSSPTPAPSQGSVATSSDPGVEWLPASAQLVLRIRFSEGRSSPLFRRLMSSKPMFAEEMAPLDQFAAAAGLDLMHDVDLAWIATDGSGGGAGGASVAVLSGRLDSQILADRLEEKAASKSSYEGSMLYALPAARSSRALSPGSAAGTGVGSAATASPGTAERASSGTVVALPRPGWAIVGNSAWVRLALDRMSGKGQGIDSSAHVGPLIGKRDQKSTIWSAAGTRAIARKLESEWDTSQIDAEDLQSIRHLVASFRITNQVNFDSEATTTSGEDADLLAVTLRGVIAVAGLRATVSDPDLAGFLRGLSVDRTEAGVRLRGVIPASIAAR